MVLEKIKSQFGKVDWNRPCRDEFHLLIAGMCFISGLGAIDKKNRSESMLALPPLLQEVWTYTLIVTSILILLGAFWANERGGYWPELAGMLGLGFVTATYATTVIFYLEGQSPFGASILLVVSLACFVRSGKIIYKIWKKETHQELVVLEVKKLVEEQAREKVQEARQEGEL